jgi:hypothetical protein
MPFLIEAGDRTEKIAQKYRLKDLRDLHCDPRTKVACLCVKQEESVRFPQGAGLPDFIESLVVPYLFGLSYFDERGRWPWGEYSHGSLGIIEYYAGTSGVASAETIDETLSLLKKAGGRAEYNRQIREPSAMRMCMCGSRKPISRCHKNAWAGIMKLNSDIQLLGLDLDRTLRR